MPMNRGRATIVLAGDKDWYGVGHNAVCGFGGTDYLVFHVYDANDREIPKLRTEKLEWPKGWAEIINTTQK
jgi:arabinan endo-1,5-alpha-L-arabinosidase